MINPNVWIETPAIQSGIITASNSIRAGVNTYATDGIIKRRNREITSTSIFTGAITAPTVKLSSIEYSGSSGLDTLILKNGT